MTEVRRRERREEGREDWLATTSTSLRLSLEEQPVRKRGSQEER